MEGTGAIAADTASGLDEGIFSEFVCTDVIASDKLRHFQSIKSLCGIYLSDENIEEYLRDKITTLRIYQNTQGVTRAICIYKKEGNNIFVYLICSKEKGLGYFILNYELPKNIAGIPCTITIPQPSPEIIRIKLYEHYGFEYISYKYIKEFTGEGDLSTELSPKKKKELKEDIKKNKVVIGYECSQCGKVVNEDNYNPASYKCDECMMSY